MFSQAHSETKSPPGKSESSAAQERRSQPPPMEKSLPAKPERALMRQQFQAEAEQRQHFIFSDYYILLRIFEYLNAQDLLRVARVCRMWRDLAVHPSLWKTVRMRDEVTDWDGLAKTLKKHGTQHLKLVAAVESDGISKKFVSVTSVVKLELCRCPAIVVEKVIDNCPQLEVLSAMAIECYTFLNLESSGNLICCQELKLRAINWICLMGGPSPLQTLTKLTHLSVTTVKELCWWRLDILESLTNLETLEIGECSDLPKEFGTQVLPKLHSLKRLRLEEGEGLSCCTFDILEGVSKLENLSQLELVNFNVKEGFDKCLANCKNIKRLLIIPRLSCTCISKVATMNNMVLGGVTKLSNNLTQFVWGFTPEMLLVTGDSIPILKPLSCSKLVEDIEDDSLKGDDQVLPDQTNSRVKYYSLPQLQKFLITVLPKTRVKILNIPFHLTWKQRISDSLPQ